MAWAAGELDPTFGGDGKVETDFVKSADREYFDEAFGLAIQLDGKLVAAGHTLAGIEPPNFGVVRYNADGSRDLGFDADGRTLTDFGTDDRANDVVIQTDGKLVAAGQSGDDFALARYNPDGSRDLTFDGDGRVLTNYGPDSPDGAFHVAIQADGKIVAAGHFGPYFGLARYLP